MSVDTTFPSLGVPDTLASVLAARGITVPTPIQTATLPDSLAGRDVLGRGRTGSGKTYAFLVPMLARLSASRAPRQSRRPRALILAPTRELVTQIQAAMAPLAEPLGISSVTIFGGVGQNPQVSALRKGVDVVLACPGRLEDLLQQGALTLDGIEVTILDEADHMADLGFLPGVKRILDKTPRDGQKLLFSATLDAGIDVIVKRYLSNPVTHQADSAQSPISTMSHHIFHVHRDARLDVLLDLTSAPGRKVVFTRTKHGAKKLAKQLNASGVPAVELHGNLGQGARDRNMAAFHEGKASTLVATDIAARGIHVDDVSLVIHADPPVEHKAYLHRSGRTARAGAEGTVITLMTDDQVSDVRILTNKAGIKAKTTRLGLGHPMLLEVAPGERTTTGGLVLTAPPQPAASGRSGGAQSRRGGSGRSGTSARAGEGSRSGDGARSGGGRRGGRSAGAQDSTGGARAAGGRPGGQRSGQGSSGGQRSGGQRSGGRAAGGSTTAYSTSSGGAAAFSAGSRGGSRGGR
ncbi:DEAD/DEAH box helicase [Pedococcus sp. KACC 23699]|uniref:DEAD/DEAH box helicase n=1 Tax=Pedococcus sp. KACC 23699 TaxID=3149228 RepID=A0AAU7JSU7_9MICO